MKLCRSYAPLLGLLFTVMLMVWAGEVKGQKVYANSVISSNSGVTNPTNASSSSESFAKMSVGALSGPASIQLGFNSDVPANQTVYIKVSSTDNIAITAANSGTSVAISTSSTSFNSPDNNYYIGISSTSAFNSITIRLNFVLLASNTTNLYYAFYNAPNSSNCGLPIATSIETGLLSSVQTPGYAIDGDITTSATLNVTLLGEAKEIIYFPENSTLGDAIRTSLILPGGISVLGNMSMQAYNGSTAVGIPIVLGSLLNISGQTQFTFDFVPPGIFDRVQYKLGGLLSLTGGLSIVEVQKVSNISIANASNIGLLNTCGTTAAITVQNPESGVTYNWYNAPTGGSPIFTGSSYSVAGLNIGTVKTYYVEGIKSGCTNQLRYAVQVTPLALPANSPITGGNSVCNGSTITLANATSGGVWSSSDPTKASIDATGKVTALQSGDITIIYTTTNTTTGCQNSSILAFTILPTPTLTAIPNQTLCAGQSIDLTTLNPTSTIVGGSYVWSETQGGTALSSTTITPTGSTLWVRYSITNGCYADQSVLITVNDLPTLKMTTPVVAIPEGSSSLILSAETNATNVQWYDQDGHVIGATTNITIVPPATAGIYNYSIIVNNGTGTCSSSASVAISVYSGTVCPPLTQRVYANDASTTSGNVTNAALAADGDPKTGSTLTSPISLLGLGAATQNLSWNTTVAAGTPVTIKFGPGVNLLGLGSGISVIPFKKNGSGITTIGNTLSMNAALLTLLPGTNMLEYTFIPSNASGVPQAYDGVKITLNALLSLGLTANIYEAYYYKTAPSLDCTKDVLDVLSGAEAPLGIGAATATVNVTNPWGVVDNSGTPTVLTNTIGVGAYAKERIIFSSQSLPGDSLKIVTSVTGTILNLGLLGGFSIQRYLGSSPVGDLIAGNGSLLTLKLLDGGTKAALILAPMAEPYDAIEIRLGNVLSVFNSLNLHQIQRIANTRAIGADVNNYIEVCEGTNVALPTTSCTTFEWYTTPTGGTPVYTGQSLSTTGLTGTKVYYIQPVRYDCKNMPRGILTVKINALPSPGTITGNSNVCIGQTLSLSNTTAPGGIWASVDESKVTIDATGTVTGVAIGTTSITYTVTNGTTGCSSTTTKSITVNAIPTVSAITGNSALCVGNTIQLFNGTPGGIWASSNTANATISSSGLVTALADGPTTITYTITSSGCSNAALKIITVYPQPTAAISGTNSICQNAPAPYVTFTGAGGTAPYTFTYNINGGLSQSITTISGNSIDLTVPTGITGTFAYNLLGVTDASASQCTQAQAGTATITINPPPSITLGSDPFVCTGIATTILSYSATTSTPTDYSITWNTAAHLAGFQDISYTTLPPTSITIPVPTTAAPATYGGTITVKNANGCVSTATTFNVVIHTKLSNPYINITSN